MGLFVSQRESKDRAINAIETLQKYMEENEYVTPPDLETAACFDLIQQNSRGWGVDQGKLDALMRSQIFSGNFRGAIKVIESAIPDERMRLFPGIVIAIIAWPFRFIWSIISLGFKK